jgi:two-component system, OmpR family, phosphate regulon sensor histidine kinase PhoR
MFWRLFSSFAALLLLTIALLGIIVLNRVEQQFMQQIQESLEAKAILVREALQSKAQEQDLQERVRNLGSETGLRITLIDSSGDVLADSHEDPKKMEKHDTRPEILAARSGDFGSATRFSTTLHQSMIYVALRMEPPQQGVAYVRVALPLSTIQAQLSELRGLGWTGAAITAVAAMILAFWLARRITQPLHELTIGAESISTGSYGHKVYTNGNDEVGILASTFNQMSERLAHQIEQLEADRHQLRAILSGMMEGVMALDAEERILFANERASQFLEFQPSQAVGRKLYEVIRHRSLQEVARRALASPEPFQEELSGTSGKSLIVHGTGLTGSPTRGAVLVFYDASELRRLERLRQEFVANVSHELKTPLAIIKANIETLVEGAVDDREHRGRFLEQVSTQADRLHALILDLLSLAQIESGSEVFEYRAVPLNEAVQACLERHRARAEGKRQQLEAVVAPDHLAAWADEEALGQILDNLVDNAIKYTPEGGRITVACQEEPTQVQIVVRDTGIGIAESHLARIFERFYRVDKARSRELGGTGLGLAIVKHLVQAMRGTIQATSQIGKGSVFCVRLPRAVSMESANTVVAN